jgi:UDP-N-acetylmuramyl pentapeptide phosphotransferase/UDP-N-acetylglucosamine-1-phosphate transferase
MNPVRDDAPERLFATLGWIGLAFVLLLAVAPLVARMLCRAFGLLKPNFRGEKIPAAAGLTFLVVSGVVYGALLGNGTALGSFYTPAFLMVTLGFGLLGLIDDLWGSRSVGGFKGHLKALFSGRPTTGAIKLIGGGFVALAASYVLHRTDVAPLLCDAALIALAANALNLLDVRPGRALFGFTLLALPALLDTLLAVRHARFTAPTPLPDDLLWQTPPGVLIGPVVCAAAVEWLPDVRAKAMMGDTGSNLLGAAAGLAAAVSLPLWGRLALLALLVGLNLLAERVSLSALIERTPWLRALDRRLGAR